jgi:hypothetical protein
MSRRRHEVGGRARPNGGGRPRPRWRPPRRRGFIARASERGVALTVLAVAAVAIAGVAIAGAVSSGGGTSVQSDPAATPLETSASPSASPRGPISPTSEPTRLSSPSPQPTHTSAPSPKPSRTATETHASASPSPKATSTSASSACSPTAKRIAAARRLLLHQDALPQVTLITAGPRQGLLGDADASARTITLYVRSCADEPTLQLAAVWGYEAGQFIPVQLWDTAKQSKWEQLRGSGTLSYTQTKQDAASVYTYWQTGTTRYWNSPAAPPTAGQLSKLVPFLQTG